MRYEIRLDEKLGPLLLSALEPAHTAHAPPSTRLVVVASEPLQPAIVRRLSELGIEIEELRCLVVSDDL